jgi:hypothetical protein
MVLHAMVTEETALPLISITEVPRIVVSPVNIA